MNRDSKPNGSSPANRRNWPRYEVDWQFQIEGVDKNGRVFWVDGTLHDISARGSSGYCIDPPESGTRVVVSIKLPFKGQNWIRYIAEIVRVEDSQRGSFVALHFVSNRPVFYSQDGRSKGAAHPTEGNITQMKSNVIAIA